MKKIFLLTALAGLVFAINGCSFVQKATQYVEKHCPETKVTDSTGTTHIHYKCDSLWATSGITPTCSALSLCIDAANGTIYGDIACKTPAIPSLVGKAKLNYKVRAAKKAQLQKE